MSKNAKRSEMIKKLLYLSAAVVALVSGLLIAVRVLAPVGIQADASDQGYCEKYGIVEGRLMYNSGYALLEQGELALAEEVFAALLSYNPQVASVYVGLGDVYIQMGKTASAIENYQQAMAIEARFGWLAVVIDELENERVEFLKE